MRDYLRMYEDLRGDLRICKQRVLHFLLPRGIRYEQGGPWTVKHRDWLSSLEFADARDRKTLDKYLAPLQELEGKCSEAAEEVEQIGAQERYRQQTKTLCAFKGIKTLMPCPSQLRSGTSVASPALGSSWPSWDRSPQRAPAPTSVYREESPRRATVI